MYICMCVCIYLLSCLESVVCLVADGFTVVQRVMAASKGQVCVCLVVICWIRMLAVVLHVCM